MVIFRAIVPLLVAVLALPAAGVAQNVDSCLSAHIAVNAVDKQGRIVPGFPPESFHVKAGDGLLTVKSAQTGVGHRVVLVVDVSGSINKSEHTWGIARVAAGNLLVAAPSTMRVALVLFSDRIVDTIGFDRPPTDIVERLAKLENGKGRTAILDAIDYSIKLLQPTGLGDAIYVISDGGENASKTHRTDVEKKLLAGRIRLFTFILRPRTQLATPEEAARLNLLEELTQVSGGAAVDEDSTESFDARQRLSVALQHGYDRIAHFYDLQLSIPERLAKKERLRLEIVDQDGKKRKDLSVSYPQYLLPCTH
jgi:Mg-chelatase subunit ChlD